MALTAVRPRGYWGLPAFASLSMAGSVGRFNMQLKPKIGRFNMQLKPKTGRFNMQLVFFREKTKLSTGKSKKIGRFNMQLKQK